jgi:hypothetical protein
MSTIVIIIIIVKAGPSRTDSNVGSQTHQNSPMTSRVRRSAAVLSGLKSAAHDEMMMMIMTMMVMMR